MVFNCTTLYREVFLLIASYTVSVVDKITKPPVTKFYVTVLKGVTA